METETDEDLEEMLLGVDLWELDESLEELGEGERELLFGCFVKLGRYDFTLCDLNLLNSGKFDGTSSPSSFSFNPCIRLDILLI